LKFTLPSESISRLAGLSKQIKDIAALTKSYIFVKDNNLKVILYSSKNIVDFSIDVLDAEDGNFVVTSIIEFIQTVTKLGKSSSVKVDVSNSKITIENELQSKIALSCYDSTEESEYEEVLSAFEDTKNETFAESVDVNVSDKLISFFRTASRYMATTNSSNSICVTKDKAKYSDVLIILEKTIENITNSDKEVFLQKQIIDFVEPIAKACKSDVKISLTQDSNFALIDNQECGIKAIFGLPPVAFDFPSAEELSFVTPERTRNVVFEIKREDIIEAIDIFNGTFRADNWNWSNIDLIYNQDCFDKEYLKLEHSDFTAECSTKLPVKILESTDAPENFDDVIKTSASVIQEFFRELVETETATLQLNSISPQEEHGIGIVFTSWDEHQNVVSRAICTKIRSAA
jgi:hypothetical protein